MESWKENIVHFIGRVGDLNFQYAVWLNGSFEDIISNFGEAVNTLDDFLFFEKVEDRSIRFNDEKLQENLVSFSASLLSYQEPNRMEEMLEDEKWLKVVGKARIIYLNSNLLILEE